MYLFLEAEIQPGEHSLLTDEVSTVESPKNSPNSTMLLFLFFFFSPHQLLLTSSPFFGL